MTARLIFLFLAMSISQTSLAFCGFYVAKADSSLYNQASQVVMVRKDDKTVLSWLISCFKDIFLVVTTETKVVLTKPVRVF